MLVILRENAELPTRSSTGVSPRTPRPPVRARALLSVPQASRGDPRQRKRGGPNLFIHGNEGSFRSLYLLSLNAFDPVLFRSLECSPTNRYKRGFMVEGRNSKFPNVCRS